MVAGPKAAAGRLLRSAEEIWRWHGNPLLLAHVLGGSLSSSSVALDLSGHHETPPWSAPLAMRGCPGAVGGTCT